MKEILDLYNKNQPNTKYGDIYKLIYSKLNNLEDLYPPEINNIKNFNIRKSKKQSLRRKCSKFSLDLKNLRLLKVKTIIDQFDKNKNNANLIILADKEKNDLLEKVHYFYGHKGISFMREEILRLGYTWNNFNIDIYKLFFKDLVML